MTRINRRQFVASVSAASISAGAIGEDALAIRPIDAHVHVWTPNTKTYPLTDGYDKKSMDPASFTPDELFTQCKPHGVQRIVLIQMSFYGFDNRYMVEAMKKNPGVFGAVAIVDDTQAHVAKTMSDLAKQGVRGFRIYANEKNTSTWKSNEGITRMWRAAADQGLAMCLLADPGSLPAIAQQCKRFPKTKVVIDHFARIGMKGSVDQKQLDQLLALSKFANVLIKTSAFYALGAKKPPYTDLIPMIRQLRDAYGANRLMWASDCPFQLQNGNTYQASIELIREKIDFLSDAEKLAILQTTAERLFF